MSRVRTLATVAAAGALGLAGCASPPAMMPAPVMITDVIPDAFADLSPEHRTATLPVFFATDREPVDPARCEYGDERGPGLSLGITEIHFGEPGWSFEKLVSRSLDSDERVSIGCESAEDMGLLWTTIDPGEDSYAQARESTSDGDPIREPALRFARAVDADLARSTVPEIYVFVSGFNTTFAETAERIGQFAYFMGGDGVFLAYSWPTRLSAFGYMEDKQKGALSVRDLRELILFLGTHTQARRINLIGYSAGAKILADALLQIRLMHQGEDPETLQQRLRIGRVLYPAADLDVRYARSLQLDDYGDLMEAQTVYVSTGDMGLWASARLIFNAPRLGSPGAALTEADLEQIASDTGNAFVNADDAIRYAGGDAFGHGYWYANPWVNTDTLLFLRFGLPPGERGLVRSEDGSHWAFPADYPERLPRVWEALLEARESPASD